MKRAIFLDRDGVINSANVINGLPFPPKDIDGLKILPGVQQALNAFRQEGYLLIVITNQPDVARGKILASDVEKINNSLKETLALDYFFTCYHDDADNCDCRKPRPGSILKAAHKYQIDIKNSFMIGDRWRDIEAGRSAGCKTAFIDYNYKEKKPTNYDIKVETLFEAAEKILEKKIYE
jgi:D-glycero-D-manno-heptose 1,7-bisphosphate phosphatase